MHFIRSEENVFLMLFFAYMARYVRRKEKFPADILVISNLLFLFSVDYHAYFHSAYPFGFWLCHLHESSHISSNPRSASQ